MTTSAPSPARLAVRRAARRCGSAAQLSAALALLLASPAARGQSTVTLDGTSGANSISTSYTVDNGGLAIDLGFFAEYLIVGGGGAGGSTDAGGGGGGAVVSNLGGTPLRITSSSNPIVVGNGGARSTVNWTRGGDGGSSSAFGVEAIGGGGGGSGSGATTVNQTSGSGASSGGLGSTITDPVRLGTATAGNLGGIGAGTRGGGGGGGAGAVGQDGSGSTAGNGGFGVQNATTGTAIYYGDGGGGGHGSANTTTGGSGRGGAGNPSGNGGNGQANSGSGGGGGGASFGQGGNGGSGIVVVRYAGGSTGITGGTITAGTGSAAGSTLSTFTATGASTFGVDLNARLGATLTSPVTGTGGFTFAGPGRLTLAAANTFTGTARITAGTLSLGNLNSLQNATLDMNAADAGTIGFAVGGSNTYALAGLTGSRNIALGGNTLAIGAAGATSEYGGVLSGTGGLTKNGAGTLTLSGANLYSGATAIDAGTLKLTSPNASSGYAIASGGVLEIEVADGLTTTFTDGTYTGSGTLRKTGAGRIRWIGATSFALDSAATIDVQEGVLQASVVANQPWGDNQASLNVASGGMFDVDAAAVRVSGLTGSGTVRLGLAGDFPLQKLTVGVADATSEFAGVIQNGSASAPLEKIGAGTLTLTGTNTYTGITTITAGTLRVGNGGTAGTLGGGNVVNNATLEFDRSDNVSVANVLSGSGTVVKNGAGTTTLSARNTYTGGTTINAGSLRLTAVNDSASYAIAAGAVLELSSNSDLFFQGGTYSGAGILRKTGSGELQWRTAGGVVPAINLGPAATIDVQAGRLQASFAGNQIWVDNQATLNVAAGAEFAVDAADARFSGLTGSGTVTLGLAPLATYPLQKLTVGLADATSVFAGVIRNGTGTAPFEKVGTGTLTLSGENTFTGGITVSAGTLATDAAGRLAASNTAAIASGATLSLGGDQTLAVVTGSGTLDLAAGTLSVGATTGEFAGTITGAGNLAKAGVGTLTFSGTASGFTGQVRVEAGTLALGSGGSFAAGASALLAGGTLDLAGTSQTFTAVTGTAGTIALGAGTLTVNNATTNTFTGVISGSGGLVKSAAGNLVLSGSNSYTGPTSITAGRLSVNGSLANTAVTVQSGAELGGTGSLGGAVVAQSGGRVSPGNSIGVLTQGETTFEAGAIFKYEVDSRLLGNLAEAADLLVVNGALNITAGTLLEFSDLAGLAAQPFVQDTTVFAMINYSGAWNGGLFTYNDQELGNLSRFMVGDQMWEIDYAATSGGLNFTDDYVSGSFVTITAVPEPATLALLAAAGLGLAALARRRR